MAKTYLRKSKRQRRAIKKRRGNRRSKSGMSVMNQYATSLETVNFNTITDNSLYQHSFSLAQFPRSSAIAACYKWCRPVEVCYEYTPLYNTFQEQTTGGAGVTVPLFFSYMNRTGNTRVPSATANQLPWILSTGTKPRMFNKKIVLKYKPNWLSSGLLISASNDNGIQSLTSMGSKAEFGWVPCPNDVPQAVTAKGDYALEPPTQTYTPDIIPQDVTGVPVPSSAVNVSTNGINYQGHFTYIRQAVEGSTQAVAELRITVKWEFKNPNPQYYLFEVRDPEQLAKIV